MAYRPTAPPCLDDVAPPSRATRNLAPMSQKPVTSVAAVSRLLGMSLEEFSVSDYMVEISVPWWHETLWWVPTRHCIEVLSKEGINRGRIWTSGELIDLCRIDDLQEKDIRSIAILKAQFGVKILSVENWEPRLGPAQEATGPKHCRACHGTRFWLSIHGVTVCGKCHPPASSNLVARWVGDGDGDGAAS